jgi:hypothetical protein
VTWWSGWDSMIESAKGWADPYIADAYILFGRAASFWFIWLGIGCLVLLLVFEIIDRNARRDTQRNTAGTIKVVATAKQRQAGGHRRTSQRTKFQTKKSRST